MRLTVAAVISMFVLNDHYMASVGIRNYKLGKRMRNSWPHHRLSGYFEQVELNGDSITKDYDNEKTGMLTQTLYTCVGVTRAGMTSPVLLCTLHKG